MEVKNKNQNQRTRHTDELAEIYDVRGFEIT